MECLDAHKSKTAISENYNKKLHLFFLGKTPSAVPSTSKKVITNKTVLPPVVVKQEFGNHAKPRPPNHNNNNNNIPSHLDVPKKLPSAKKSPPPEIKLENNGIKMEGESFLFESLELGIILILKVE